MVDVVLTEKGSKKLLDFTSQNVKRRVALFLDGKLLVVPIILDPLASGILSISGDFDRPEIQIITDRINALIREAASL
jgi:preprotein translocase subunit SecD